MFRHATDIFGEAEDVRLGWVARGGDWVARISMRSEVTPERFLYLFVQARSLRTARPEFEWAEQIKKNSPELFRKVAALHPELEDWFAAFGSELALANDGTIRSTDFDMTGGQQRFLAKLREANQAIASSQEEARKLLNEAIFGPWQYRRATKGLEAENSHSMGLDPSTLLEGAFTGAEPAGIKDKRGIRGAIYLAFEALPLFPCVVANGRLQTAGFVRDRSERQRPTSYFVWGVWEAPLSIESVRMLLLQSRDEWTPERGFVARFSSERISLNKYLCSFGQAELVTSDSFERD